MLHCSLKIGNKNGVEISLEFPQEGILYVRKYQKWETTKGYQKIDEQGSSMPSLVFGLSEVPLLCRAQC